MDESASGRRWWQGAVLYQLYVRSWRDTDGDGYGDLDGVIAGLDYLSWLGVDGIWLSPTMPSPDQDWGYDVSDYLGVHPELGTLADLDRLIAEARRARACGYCSTWCPTTPAAPTPGSSTPRAAGTPAHRDYYVWADPAPGGGPPNNWLDATGAHRVGLAPADRPVLPAPLPGQPARPELAPARGARGVPRDPPVLVRPRRRRVPHRRGARPVQGRAAARRPPGDRLGPAPGPVRPAAGLTARTGRRRTASTGTGARSPRATGRRGCCSARPGWGTSAGSPRSTGTTTSCSWRSTSRSCSPRSPRASCPSVAGATLARLPAGACPVWTASNHDVGRFPTRWCGGDERKVRLALLVLATLPGTTVLYYGDEIGMTDVDGPARAAAGRDVAGPAAAGTAAGTAPGPRCSGTPRVPAASPPRA